MVATSTSISCSWKASMTFSTSRALILAVSHAPRELPAPASSASHRLSIVKTVGS